MAIECVHVNFREIFVFHPNPRWLLAQGLFHLALHDANKPRVVAAGGVNLLVSFLLQKRAGLLDESLAVLAVLALCQEGMMTMLRASIIPNLVEILTLGTPKSRENAVAVLLSLCQTGGDAVISRLSKYSHQIVATLCSLLVVGSERGKRKAKALMRFLVATDSSVSSGSSYSHESFSSGSFCRTPWHNSWRELLGRMNYNHLEDISAILMELQKFAKKGYGTPQEQSSGVQMWRLSLWRTKHHGMTLMSIASVFTWPDLTRQTNASLHLICHGLIIAITIASALSWLGLKLSYGSWVVHSAQLLDTFLEESSSGVWITTIWKSDQLFWMEPQMSAKKGCGTVAILGVQMWNLSLANKTPWIDHRYEYCFCVFLAGF